MNQNKIFPFLFPVILFLVIVGMYFAPQFQGKGLIRSDAIQGEAKIHYMKEMGKQNNEVYIWNPSQFGGMPMLYSAPGHQNFMRYVHKVFTLGQYNGFGIIFAGMLIAYLIGLLLGFTVLESTLLALMVGLPLTNIILWKAGHTSKINVLVYTSMLVGGVLLVFEKKKYVLGFILFLLGMGVSLHLRHPQMTYYIFIVFGVYGIFKLVDIIKTKDYGHLAKSLCVLLFATLLGIGSATSKIWSMKVHSEASMRGKPVLKNINSGDALNISSTTDGLNFEYAMGWSNGFVDLISTFIPGFSGGGSGEYVGRNSETFKQFGSEIAPLYWGKLPFTESPMYIGVISFFLFVLGAFYVKGYLKWWLVVSMILVYLVSLGKNFEVLNKLLFEYLPLYNKFRTPQSVLSIVPYFMPLLGLLAISQFAKKKDKKEFVKASMISFGFVGGFALLSLTIFPSLLSFEGQAEQYNLPGIIADRKELFKKDALRSLMLVSSSTALLYFFAQGKLNKLLALGGVAILVVVDNMGINLRYLSAKDYVLKSEIKNHYQPRSVDTQIMQMEDSREQYRVLDRSVNTFNDASTAYFHNTIGGYDPVKLQRFQDIIDFYITKGNTNVLNMLNTKYVIVPGENKQATAQLNSGVLGPAWFVDNIKIVRTPEEEILALKELDVANTAVILDDEFGSYIGNFDPIRDTLGSINISSYTPDKIVYKTSASSEQFAVFSEIWFNGKAWKVYVDGKEVPFVRVNYLLRGMKIPAGKHDITFEFRPKSIILGNKLTVLFSLLSLFLVGFGLFLVSKNKEWGDFSTRVDFWDKLETKTKPNIQSKKKKTKTTKKVKRGK